MTAIRITQKDGLVEFLCPMCLHLTQLPLSEYECQIKDGKMMTIKKLNAKEKENPYRIDLTKKDGHTVNCDFILVDAPVEVVEPPKEKEENSSQDSQKVEQNP